MDPHSLGTLTAASNTAKAVCLCLELGSRFSTSCKRLTSKPLQAPDMLCGGVQKRYADEDFQLTPAGVAQLWAQQNTELEDTDIPPIHVLSPPAAQQFTPTLPAPQRELSPSVPAAAVVAALQTSASKAAAATNAVPAPTASGKAAAGQAAADKAALSKTALGKAAVSGTPPTAASQPGLKHATPAPVTKADHSAPGARTGSAHGVADAAPAASEGPDQLRRVPHSPLQNLAQDLHSAAATASPPTAAAAAAAESSAGVSRAGQKSCSKVWLPPAALASPKRSPGEATEQSWTRLLVGLAALMPVCLGFISCSFLTSSFSSPLPSPPPSPHPLTSPHLTSPPFPSPPLPPSMPALLASCLPPYFPFLSPLFGKQTGCLPGLTTSQLLYHCFHILKLSCGCLEFRCDTTSL